MENDGLLSLPPGVKGVPKGAVVCELSSVKLTNTRAVEVVVAPRWWGQPASAAEVKLSGENKAESISYPVCCGPRHLVRYLRDAQVLTLDIKCGSTTLGTATVDIAQLDTSQPVNGTFPISKHGIQQQRAGSLDVHLSVHFYTGAASSFELHEAVGPPLPSAAAIGNAVDQLDLFELLHSCIQRNFQTFVTVYKIWEGGGRSHSNVPSLVRLLQNHRVFPYPVTEEQAIFLVSVLDPACNLSYSLDELLLAVRQSQEVGLRLRHGHLAQVLPSLQPLVLGLEQRSTLLRQAMRSARHGGAQGVMAVQQLTTWLHASVPGLELQQLRYLAVLLLHMSEGPVGSASLQDIITLLKVLREWGVAGHSTPQSARHRSDPAHEPALTAARSSDGLEAVSSTEGRRLSALQRLKLRMARAARAGHGIPAPPALPAGKRMIAQNLASTLDAAATGTFLANEQEPQPAPVSSLVPAPAAAPVMPHFKQLRAAGGQPAAATLLAAAAPVRLTSASSAAVRMQVSEPTGRRATTSLVDPSAAGDGPAPALTLPLNLTVKQQLIDKARELQRKLGAAISGLPAPSQQLLDAGPSSQAWLPGRPRAWQPGMAGVSSAGAPPLTTTADELAGVEEQLPGPPLAAPGLPHGQGRQGGSPSMRARAQRKALDQLLVSMAGSDLLRKDQGTGRSGQSSPVQSDSRGQEGWDDEGDDAAGFVEDQLLKQLFFGRTAGRQLEGGKQRTPVRPEQGQDGWLSDPEPKGPDRRSVQQQLGRQTAGWSPGQGPLLQLRQNGQGIPQEAAAISSQDLAERSTGQQETREAVPRPGLTSSGGPHSSPASPCQQSDDLQAEAEEAEQGAAVLMEVQRLQLHQVKAGSWVGLTFRASCCTRQQSRLLCLPAQPAASPGGNTPELALRCCLPAAVPAMPLTAAPATVVVEVYSLTQTPTQLQFPQLAQPPSSLGVSRSDPQFQLPPHPSRLAERGQPCPPELLLEQGELVGVVKVPLALTPGTAGTAAGAHARGTFPVMGVLQAGGGWVGSLDLAAALQRAVPLTRHTWRVTVCGALGLPDEAQLGAAGLPVPSSRYAKYYYPGEASALFTEDVPPSDAPIFAATATHCLLLPAGVSPTPELLSLQTSDAQLLAPQLVFEVWDRWSSGPDTCVGRSLLPLHTLLAHEPGAPALHTLPLALASGAVEHIMAQQEQEQLEQLQHAQGLSTAGPQAERQQQGQAVAVAVVPVVEVRLQVERVVVGPSDSQWQPPSSPSGTLPALDRAAEGPALGSSAPAPAPSPPLQPKLARLSVDIARACGLQAAVQEAQAWLGGGSSVLGRAHQLGPHSYVTLSLFPGSEKLARHVGPLRTPFQAQAFCPEYSWHADVELWLDPASLVALATSPLCLEVWHHPSRALAALAAQQRAASRGVLPAPGLPGEAGGRAAAAEVRDVLLGSGSYSLSRLLTRPQGLQTWVVVKSARGEAVGAVQLSLALTHVDGQELDRCLSAPPPLHQVPGLVDLLPPHLLPLLPLMSIARAGREEQGSHSQAPQLELNKDKEQEHQGSAAGQGPGAGLLGVFGGKWCRLTLYLEQITLPLGGLGVAGVAASSARAGPVKYHAVYTLPGSGVEVDTVAKPALAHDGAKGSKPSVTQLPGATVARPSLVSQVALGHVGVHWVQVTAQLLGALLHDPLKIVVWRSQERHPHSSAAVTSGPSNSNANITTAVGNVDVDLAPLLQQAADRKQAARWLSGSHLLIDPGAKYFLGARIRVKALLELSPPSRPSSAILAASCWQPCESFTIHQKPHNSPPRTQPNATAVAQQDQEPAPESPGQAGQRHSPGPEMRPQPQHPAMLLCNQVPSPTPGQGDVPSTSSTARTPTPGNPSTPAAQQQSPALDTDDIAVGSVQAPDISTHPLRSGAQGSSSHGVQGGQPCSPEANSPSACADEELAAQLKAQLHELDIMQHQWQYRLQQPQLSPHHSPAQAENPGARRRGGAVGQQAAGPSAHDPWSWQWDISRQPLQPSSPPAAQLSPPALHAVAGRGLVSPPPMQQHAESLGSQAPALRVDSQLTVANVQGLAALSSRGRGVSGEGSMSGWADGLLVSTGGGGVRMLHVGPGPGGEVSPQGMARLAAVQTCSDDGAGEGGCWGGASSSEADTDELLASIPVATQREEYCGPGRGSRAAADAPPTPSDSHSSGLGPASPAQPPPGSSSSLRGRGRAGQGALHPNEEWAFSVAKQGVGRLRASTAQHPAMLLSPSWSPSASHGTLAAEEDLPRSVPRSGEEAGCGETASVSGQQGPRPDQLGSAASDRDLGSGSALGAPGPDVQPAGPQGAAGWGGEAAAAAAVVVDAAGLQPGRGHAAVVGSLQARLDAMFEEFKQQVRGS